VLAAAPAKAAIAKAGFDPDQPRDDHGMWTSDGGDGSKPVQVADSGQIATDAAPEQIAQEEDKEREDEPGSAPARQAAYASLHEKLRLIDPSNPALPAVHSRDRIPSNADLSNIEDALDRAVENHAEAAASHAYSKHVDERQEFPEIAGQVQLQLLAQEVMKSSPAEPIARGRVMFYQSKTNTLVIINPRHSEEDNVFRPDERQVYVDRLRKGK